MKDINILTSNGVNLQKALQIFGDMETYNEILGTFLVEIEEKLSKAKQYKVNGDMANYAIYVHSIKSDARNFGFEKLGEIAYQHEMESKANNMYFVYENFDDLINEARRIILVINQYMEKESVTAPVTSVSQEEPKEASVPNFVTDTNKTKKLLVVDDSKIIRTLIQNIFKNSFEVLTANDGEEAIKIIENSGDELVGMLLDLMMPNIDGFSVLDFFKDKGLFDKIPVSIITGIDSKDVIDRAFTYPIVDMLQKPFNEFNVRAIVEKTINKIKA